jgi:hypothetical protein
MWAPALGSVPVRGRLFIPVLAGRVALVPGIDCLGQVFGLLQFLV